MSPAAELANPYASDGDRLRTPGRPLRMAARALTAGAIGLGGVVTFAGTGFADEADPTDGVSELAQGADDNRSGGPREGEVVQSGGSATPDGRGAIDDASVRDADSESNGERPLTPPAEEPVAQIDVGEEPEHFESESGVVPTADFETATPDIDPNEGRAEIGGPEVGGPEVLIVDDGTREMPESDDSDEIVLGAEDIEQPTFGNDQDGQRVPESDPGPPVEAFIDDDLRAVPGPNEQYGPGFIEIGGVRYVVDSPIPADVEAPDAGEAEVPGGEVSGDEPFDAWRSEVGGPEVGIGSEAGESEVPMASAGAPEQPESGNAGDSGGQLPVAEPPALPTSGVDQGGQPTVEFVPGPTVEIEIGGVTYDLVRLRPSESAQVSDRAEPIGDTVDGQPTGAGDLDAPDRPLLPGTIELPEDVREELPQVAAGDPARVTVGSVGEEPDPDGIRSVSRSITTSDPQTPPGYVGGAPDRGREGGLNVPTTNRVGITGGTLPPAKAPTGDEVARWNGFELSAGPDGNLVPRNGDSGDESSGTLSRPITFSAHRGSEGSGRRSGASASTSYTPQVDSAGDSSTEASVDVGWQSSVGPRPGKDGRIEQGVGYGGRVFAEAGLVNGRQVPVRGATEPVETNQTRYRAGANLFVEAAERQPTNGANARFDLEGSLGGSSIVTEAGGGNTRGPDARLTANATGGLWWATARAGEPRVVFLANGHAGMVLGREGTRSSAAATVGARGELPLNDDGTVLAGRGDYTVSTGDGGGLGVGASVATPVFGGLGAIEVQRRPGEEPTVALSFTDRRPAPQPEPVGTPEPVVLDSTITPSLAATDIDFSNVVVPAPAAAEPAAPAVAAGPVTSADGLRGTTPVGIGVTESSPPEQASAVPDLLTGGTAVELSAEPVDPPAEALTGDPEVAPVEVPAGAQAKESADTSATTPTQTPTTELVDGPANGPTAADEPPAPPVDDTPSDVSSEPSPQVETPENPEPSGSVDTPDLGGLSLDLPSVDVPSTFDLSDLSSPALSTSTYRMPSLPPFDVSSFSTPSFSFAG